MVGGLAAFYGIFPLTSPAEFGRDESMSTVGAVLLGLVCVFVIGPATLATGLYFYRGQGPSTEDVEKRLDDQRDNANDSTRDAARFWRRGRPLADVHVAAPDVARAAQVDAVANPETARALQNLQNLLYTQAISDEEYQQAKDRLLGVHPAIADSFVQITKLVELHQAGILSDLEFAAAKARVLGL